MAEPGHPGRRPRPGPRAAHNGMTKRLLMTQRELRRGSSTSSSETSIRGEEGPLVARHSRHCSRWALAAALLVCLLSGAAAQAQEITFWVMPNAPDVIHVPWLEEKTQQFFEETGIRVHYEIIGWDEAWIRISTALITGEGVDVFQAGTTWNPQFAATGAVSELNIDEFGGADAFMAANLTSTTYQGRYYGVPWFAETRVLFYNEDMFAAAGVQPPQTYSELMEAGQRIVETHGTGSAIAIAGTNVWDLIHNWAIILWANGGDLVDMAGRRAAFNGPEGVAAMEYYVDLVRQGLASCAIGRVQPAPGRRRLH